MSFLRRLFGGKKELMPEEEDQTAKSLAKVIAAVESGKNSPQGIDMGMLTEALDSVAFCTRCTYKFSISDAIDITNPPLSVVCPKCKEVLLSASQG